MEESTADTTWNGGKNRSRRRKRQVERMSEEMGGLKESEVTIITNKECEEKLKGFHKVKPTYICALTPGSRIEWNKF